MVRFRPLYLSRLGRHHWEVGVAPAVSVRYRGTQAQALRFASLYWFLYVRPAQQRPALLAELRPAGRAA